MRAPLLTNPAPLYYGQISGVQSGVYFYRLKVIFNPGAGNERVLFSPIRTFAIQRKR